MATIALYANQINQMPALIREIKQSVIDHKTELAALSNRIRTIDTAVVNLDEVVSSIQNSTLTREEKIASLDTINQNKTDFYDRYSYLKPRYEKNAWEILCDDMASVGQWCKEHRKLIVTVFIVVTAIAILCTGIGGVLLAAMATGAL